MAEKRMTYKELADLFDIPEHRVRRFIDFHRDELETKWSVSRHGKPHGVGILIDVPMTLSSKGFYIFYRNDINVAYAKYKVWSLNEDKKYLKRRGGVGDLTFVNFDMFSEVAELDTAQVNH